MEQQSGAGLSLVNEKNYSHQACDIDSQPRLCGMVGLHTASNAKYIGMTQTIVEPRRENSSILILVRHTVGFAYAHRNGYS